MSHSPRTIPRPLLITLITFVFTSIYVTFLLLPIFEQKKLVEAIAWRQMVLGYVMGFAYAWAFFYLISVHRIVLAIMLPLIFLFSMTAVYFVNQYGIRIDKNAIAVLFEAQPNLAVGFVTSSLVFYVLGTIAIVWLLLRLYFTRERKDERDIRLVVIAAAFVFSSLVFDQVTSRQYLPYNFILATYDYVAEYVGFKQKKFNIATLPMQRDDSKTEDLVVVMLIGESVRVKNMQAYGYGRDNTPTIMQQEGMVAYTQARTCAVLTRDALPCMLTRATPGNHLPSHTETSIISVFDALGFHTVTLDMHGMVASVFSSPVLEIFNEAKEVISFNTDAVLKTNHDGDLLPYLDKVLGEQSGRSFMFVHSFGSHWPFDVRYPDTFRKWTPVCTNKGALIFLSDEMRACEPDALINAYDNSILYADHILGEIVARLKDRNALVVYTSDHGQLLGENGRYLHGIQDDSDELNHIPIVWWASEKFITKHPTAYNNLRKNKDKQVSHDVLFHSLLDCSGIESEELIDINLSVCR